MISSEQVQEIAKQPLGEAKTLPFAAYHDPQVLESEQVEIFSRDWVYCCTEADIAEPGDYQTLSVGDEPVLVIRGKDHKLRALSNVCRHRGATLLSGSGNTHRLSCPFHAWTYSDEGKLQGVPFPGKVEVDRHAHCLPQYRLESWFGLVFVSLNEHVLPLSERFRGLEAQFTELGVDDFQQGVGLKVETWQANWKIIMANFVEGYHFFAVHRDSVEQAAATRDCYYIDGCRNWSITAGKQLGYPETMTDWITGKSSETTFLSICLPPNFVCNLYPGYLTWARVLPIGPDCSEIASGTLSASRFKASPGETALYDQIFAEDRAICERVQQGVRSTRTQGGTLVELEHAVVDFHQYWAHSMNGQ